MGFHLGGSEDLRQSCSSYVQSRKATYRFRKPRFDDAAAKLNIQPHSTLLDIGGGNGDFGRAVSDIGLDCNYINLDGSTTGINLEALTRVGNPDHISCLEVLEHLHHWEHVLDLITHSYAKSAVCSVPNPEAVDVLRCDPTHVSIVPAWAFTSRGWTVEPRSYFGTTSDTLLAFRY